MVRLATHREADVDTWTFCPNRNIVATIVDDSHVRLVNFETRSTCVLDDFGMQIWSHLAEGRSTMEVIRHMRKAGSTPTDGMRNMHKVSTVLLELLRHKMIHPNWCWEPKASLAPASA